jgi:hypothetical protein
MSIGPKPTLAVRSPLPEEEATDAFGSSSKDVGVADPSHQHVNRQGHKLTLDNAREHCCVVCLIIVITDLQAIFQHADERHTRLFQLLRRHSGMLGGQSPLNRQNRPNLDTLGDLKDESA